MTTGQHPPTGGQPSAASLDGRRPRAPTFGASDRDFEDGAAEAVDDSHPPIVTPYMADSPVVVQLERIADALEVLVEHVTTPTRGKIW